MWTMVAAVILMGGFFDWSVAAVGIGIVVEILFLYYKKEPVYKKGRTLFNSIPVFLLIWMPVVSLWAVDPAMNWFGVLRGIVILMWMYLCFQMKENDSIQILRKIPYMGAAMVLLGVFSQVHEGLASFFWQARRFGGFFQYANTCALFLLLGMVILVQEMTEGVVTNNHCQSNELTCSKSKKYVVICGTMFLLITGIFLTGSRSILLLLIAWGIYKAFTFRKLRLPIITVMVVCIGAAYLYGLIAGDSQNIARIFTLSGANSTMLGRLLYYADGLKAVGNQPFGLGYMGYYYIQPAIQNGVYTTRFIHNDFLQVLVDYGVIAFAAVLGYLVHQLIKGKQGRRKKELLVILLLASLVDFHMQYISILMLAVLCLDLGEKKTLQKRKDLRENYAFCVVAALAFFYVFISAAACQLGNYPLALQLLPKYTEAQVGYMNTCTQKEEAVFMAEEILLHNEYVADAYHTRMYAAMLEEDYSTVLLNMDKVLSIRRYDVERYMAYDELLGEMIVSCESGKPQEAEQLRQFQNGLPLRLAELEESTSSLAFMLRDKPVFEW